MGGGPKGARNALDAYAYAYAYACALAHVQHQLWLSKFDNGPASRIDLL